MYHSITSITSITSTSIIHYQHQTYLCLFSFLNANRLTKHRRVTTQLWERCVDGQPAAFLSFSSSQPSAATTTERSHGLCHSLTHSLTHSRRTEQTDRLTERQRDRETERQKRQKRQTAPPSAARSTSDFQEAAHRSTSPEHEHRVPPLFVARACFLPL